MDLKAYQSQIRELIPLRNEPDFNELLNKILFGESNSDKFLIKMELSRLAKPCQRLLDIRDKVTEPCEIFEQDKLKHHLTKPTIKVLQKSIKLYGLYTVGAFEAVHEFIATQKNALKKRQITRKKVVKREEQCELLTLSQKNKRGAPRMFFVSDITVTLNDGKTITAQTSNISSTGLKIKLSDSLHISNETLLNITFTGLALEYHDQVLKEQVRYQLVKQENDSEEQRYFYLNYIDDNKCFNSFISEFIRLNQYKYKIDVHYYYQLAKVSALKYNYLAQMNSLPLYLDAQAPSPFLFSLKNNSNKVLLNEWHCGGIDQLSYLFHELRFIKLLAHTLSNTTVYTFTHTVKGKLYFLSATEEELNEKGLKQSFINYGRSKSSWRVYHLTLAPYQYQPSNRYDITESVPSLFKRVTHIATLQRLSKAYPFTIKTKLDKKDVNQLNQFVHRPENNTAPASVFSLFSDEQRKEARYLYASKLSVSDGKNSYNGHLVDFSHSGLKIKLEQITAFSNTTKLTIDLTELQKISKKYPLSDLHYKVIKTGANNIFHLQVCDKKTLDTCEHFFSLLVKNNAKHFTCIPLKEHKQPSLKHLVEIAEESFINCIFFLSKLSGRPKITFSAIDIADHPLHKLFSLYSDNHNELNYYPLVNNQLYERLVIQPFKESEGGLLNKEALIYIKAVKKSDQPWEISSFLDEDFNSEQEKINFIKESQFNATFYALHYRLTSLASIDLSSIKSEIRTISRFAIHLTKKLEDELCAINAMIEITDRTADIIKTVDNKIS
ncbi:PilZ domain-containing protein [Psychromonas hadalis]|uniref:PilZ domain-containing protein n=1 Tax=Psychromonas hadalis TaxID=211669 RepID=UPI0003B37876|nr:PilZ domain-containing protein [Psychromonas hadalis]